MIAVLKGMTVALPTFHGNDETSYHLPTILQFSHQLPFPDLHAYPAAQTPLYHVLMAYIGKVIGYNLWRLRLVQVLISYLLALAVYAFLQRRLRLPERVALGLTLLFMLSPYVFGQSFRLGTDNLALLFTVLAIERLERFRESESRAVFFVAAVWIAAAMLTRQSALFLVPMAGIYALLPTLRISGEQRATVLGALVLSVIPIGLLFLSWHGLVPVGSDPSSCGLCAGKGSPEGLSANGLTPHTMELTLATIGLYGSVLFAPALLEWAREAFRAHDLGKPVSAGRGPLATAVAGALLLVAFPATPGSDAAGDLWKVAEHLPAVHGSSLLFWVLVPLSGAVLWVRVTRAPRPVLVLSLIACFLVASLATHFPWQKYVDPFAVLILACTVRPDELRGRWRWAGALVLTLVFIAYTADLSSHRAVAAPNGPSATVAATVAPPPPHPLR
jgi:4-amino-4-deoxy-L-arabinose transferase-like glycosyltransferase